MQSTADDRVRIFDENDSVVAEPEGTGAGVGSTAGVGDGVGSSAGVGVGVGVVVVGFGGFVVTFGVLLHMLEPFFPLIVQESATKAFI